MDKFFDDYLDLMEELHREIGRLIEDLPQEALDWAPGPDMNSAAVLVTHLAAAARFWIGDVAMGEPSGRVRSEEFEVQGVDRETLESRLDESLAYARRALEPLAVGDLAERRLVPGDQRQVTVGWALMHALEHTANHLGHIQIARQLWQQSGRTG